MPLDKDMNGISVGVDAAHDHFAVVVRKCDGFQITLAASLRRFVPRGSGVFHFQCDHLYTVAVLVDVVRDRVIRPQRRRENERQLVLTKDIARSISRSGLRPRIRQALKPERGFIKMRCLPGISDVKLHVIGPLKRQEIGFGRGAGFRSGDSCFHRNSGFRTQIR